jgi:hypothetical protein
MQRVVCLNGKVICSYQSDRAADKAISELRDGNSIVIRTSLPCGSAIVIDVQTSELRDWAMKAAINNSLDWLQSGRVANWS